MAAKRKRQEVDEGPAQGQIIPRPRRSLRGKLDQEEQNEINGSAEEAESPPKRKRGRLPRGTNKPKVLNGLGEQLDRGSPISELKGKVLFATPTKNRRYRDEDSAEHIGHIVSNADRSARRKSARALIQRTENDDLSDDNDPHEENALAKSICDVESSGESDGRREEEDIEDNTADEPSSTPSKRAPKQRPRTRRKRTPTPPQDLPPHEMYFFQNRAGNMKTSNNTLASLSLLSHEQYNQQMKTYEDPHASSFMVLHSLHSRSFPQWNFELSQSFNICLYGYGSKRRLVTSFANHLHSLYPSPPPKIIVINGYIPNLTIRQILTTIAGVAFDSSPSSIPTKLGTQPREIVTSILTHITTSPPSSPIHIFINSLDAPPLRRAPVPSLLALLAANSHIRVLATCDTPSFHLLWDAPTREQYNFLFHDTTTYESYAPIEIGSVVDDVNKLLGRSGRSIKGKEGVGFVLQSLPENARNLYRVLVAELLASMDEDPAHDHQEQYDDNDLIGTLDQEEDEEGRGLQRSTRSGRRALAATGMGIEFRTLYHKVVEDFICTSEMAFRALLQEFHDHRMILSRRDATGQEMITVPFRREEMETILEDLVM